MRSYNSAFLTSKRRWVQGGCKLCYVNYSAPIFFCRIHPIGRCDEFLVLLHYRCPLTCVLFAPSIYARISCFARLDIRVIRSSPLVRRMDKFFVPGCRGGVFPLCVESLSGPLTKGSVSVLHHGTDTDSLSSTCR